MLKGTKSRPSRLTSRITIFCSPEYKAAFHKKALALSLSESDYGRFLITESPTQIEQKMLKDIGNIAVHIARKVGITEDQIQQIRGATK